MGVVKTRGASRRLGPIGLGRHVASFKVRNCNRHFTIHEDLLCANSKFFKEKLHKDRKAIEGECFICHEDLDPETSDITFCRAMCGRNIHTECEALQGSLFGASKMCPMCNRVWQHRTSKVISVGDELNPTAIQLYINWLYSGQLHIDETIDRDDVAFNVLLLNAWKVSAIFQDGRFKNAIIAELIASIESKGNTGLQDESIDYAYLFGTIDMQRFVVDMFLFQMEFDDFEREVGAYHTKFTQDLCIAALHSLTKMPTLGELLVKHTNGEYELQSVGEEADGDDD